MRRVRTLVIVFLSVIAGAGVGLWIGWRHLGSTSADQRAELIVRLGAWRQLEFASGAPLILDTYLTAPKGASSFRVGSAGQPWYSDLRFLDPRTGRPLAWPLSLLGTSECTVFTSGPDGRLRITQEKSDAAVVDHDHVHHIVFAASPEIMSRVSPGTYQIQAVLDGRRWPPWQWRAQLESPPVTIAVRALDGSTNRTRLERDRLAASAEFYIMAKRFDDARRAAEEWSSREPKNAGILILLGDALAGLGRPADALAAYRRALALTPRRYEEPTLLYERIQNVLGKLSR